MTWIRRTPGGRKAVQPEAGAVVGLRQCEAILLRGGGNRKRDRTVRRFVEGSLGSWGFVGFVGSILIPAYLSLNWFGGNFTDSRRFSILTEFLAGTGIARWTACDGIRNSKRGSFPGICAGRFPRKRRRMPTEHVHVISPNENGSLRTVQPGDAPGTEPRTNRTHEL